MGRLLVGFAVGTITGVAPVFGAEIAKVGCITLRTYLEVRQKLMFARHTKGPGSQLSIK